MRVLIIDDMEHKINEIIQVLKKLNIINYVIVKSVTEAYLKVRKEKYDFIISDLGLPRHPNSEVENSLAGLEMLTIFGYRNITIPTIVYSTTEMPENDLEYLKKLDYPFIGQAKDILTLNEMLINYLTDNKTASNDKISR